MTEMNYHDLNFQSGMLQVVVCVLFLDMRSLLLLVMEQG